MNMLWDLLGNVGLWAFKQLVAGQQFNQDQKAAFLNFVQAMASRSSQAAKLSQDYADEIAELKAKAEATPK